MTKHIEITPVHEKSGFRALIVEDSPLLAMDMEGMLEEAGCSKAIVVHDVASALAAIDANDIDLAILDCALRDQTSEPIAARLESSSIPFAFWSGSSAATIAEQFPLAPHVEKPCNPEAIAEVVELLLRKPIIADDIERRAAINGRGVAAAE